MASEAEPFVIGTGRTSACSNMEDLGTNSTQTF
jgi:hypothetical protein